MVHSGELGKSCKVRKRASTHCHSWMKEREEFRTGLL